MSPTTKAYNVFTGSSAARKAHALSVHMKERVCRSRLTVVEVNGLLHEAGLCRGDPQREAGLAEAKAEQFLRPVSHLEAVTTLQGKYAAVDDTCVQLYVSYSKCD